MEEQYMLEMSGINKSFGGIKALKNVDFKVKKGEIHALIGENGAGKSTLMKILSGAYLPDDGEIRIDGKLCDISGPLDAQRYGVGIIYQEFQLIPSLSVAENIFIGAFPYKAGGTVIDWKKLRSDAKAALQRIGFDIDVGAQVSDMSVAYQQMIEITKALNKKVQILVLDEPTSVLAPNEIEKLFDVMRSLKERGVTMIYISHKLEELFTICDSVTVMKDGAYVGTEKTADMTKDQLIGMMIGRKVDTMFPKRNPIERNEAVLEVRGLNSAVNRDCSLFVRKGEIVGLSGLVGSGRTELVRAIFGADAMTSGEILLEGKPVSIKNPKNAVKLGIGLIPEDRKRHGVILNKSIRQNTTMAAVSKIVHMGMIKHAEEKRAAKELAEKLRTKTPSVESDVGDLSGGNQQKVVLSKWIFSDCKVMIFDEPTRGVDVGAKSEIYQIISSLAETGKGVVVISSEMEEIIGLCDRVYVMHEGRVTGVVEKGDMTEDILMRYAIA
ncbi:MAG: sugar ABC transporter ATP-binding protein [Synergistaceae bacterium]|jgi:ribose transport system ATP-binding protein|nr:sugar ABC transporter ATP-binding protein [Synergistaceae bacterium]